MEKLNTDDVKSLVKDFTYFCNARCEYDTAKANELRERLKLFLRRDELQADMERRGENPFRSMALFDIRVEYHPELIVDFERVIVAHWRAVQGTPAGDKVPMIAFVRKTALGMGLPDTGAVASREFLEFMQLYNTALTEQTQPTGNTGG